MDLTNNLLTAIFGAKSITLTVLNHYYDEIRDDLPEDDMVKYLRELCSELNISDLGLDLLAQILQALNEFRRNRSEEITQEKFDLISQTCKAYVNWAFSSFECFEKSEDGTYTYSPNS
ncbi:MAG: hypothetical protein HOP30_21875 [Cyclobacteriaceae bacterium]|nr:hypothetical protein [Cyclobacteriaceae bacterium]